MGPAPCCVQTDTLRPMTPSPPTSIFIGRSNTTSIIGALPSRKAPKIGFNENVAHKGLVVAGLVKSPVSCILTKQGSTTPDWDSRDESAVNMACVANVDPLVLLWKTSRPAIGIGEVPVINWDGPITARAPPIESRE